MTLRFEPAVYEHAASLIGCGIHEVSRSKSKMIEAHAAAYRLYRHRPLVVGIDIYNPEAEALGAVVSETSGNGVPTLARPPCADAEEILELGELDPQRDGRLSMILGAAVELRDCFPEAEVKVPVSGPFSLASHLCGLENLLCDCMTDPETVTAALERLCGIQEVWVQAVREAGLSPAFFESAATPPLLPPGLFDSLVLPPLRRLAGNAPCILGGNTAPVLESLLSTGTRYVICPPETDQQRFMEIMRGHPEVMVRINMRPAVFCGEDPAPALREADRVMALARGRERVCIGSGVLPPEALPSTVLAVKAFVEKADAGLPLPVNR